MGLIMTESRHREYFTAGDERWIDAHIVAQKSVKEDVKSTVRKLEDENELAMERVWEKGEFYQRLKDKSKRTTDKG